MKPRLLDLFCGGGGATKGYQEAGFYVVGVDHVPQPHYIGDEFFQEDALECLRRLPSQDHAIDAIHASPPCQFYSALAAMHPSREYPDLIPEVRALLIGAGLPYVIENVERAPLNASSNLLGEHGVMLCGSMFGLETKGAHLRRHRRFETSFSLPQPVCVHKGPAVGVYGHGGHSGKHRMLYSAEAAEAMEINWMNRDEMTQAIPPAYTRYIGGALMEDLRIDKWRGYPHKWRLAAPDA